MARPRKIGLEYFPHDVDATTDPKLEPAIMRYGAAAYAFYFVHLEYCYKSDDLSIQVSAAETRRNSAETSQIGAEMRAVIQHKLHIDAQQYEDILQTLLRHGAFDAQYYAETGKLTSNGIKKRAEKVLEKRAREASRYGGGVSAAETRISAEFLPNSAEFLPLKHSKEKQSKEKKRKAINTPSLAHRKIQHLVLTTGEYEKLCAEYGACNVDRILDNMENYAKLKNYKSAYITAKNWLRLDNQRKGEVKSANERAKPEAGGFDWPSIVAAQKLRREREAAEECESAQRKTMP